RGPLHRWPAAWHVCKTVTYQKVTDQESSTLLGQVCERTSRVEFFEGHARSGDIRVTNYAGNELTWAPQQRDRWNAEASRARSRHEPDPGSPFLAGNPCPLRTARTGTTAHRSTPRDRGGPPFPTSPVSSTTCSATTQCRLRPTTASTPLVR